MTSGPSIYTRSDWVGMSPALEAAYKGRVRLRVSGDETRPLVKLVTHTPSSSGASKLEQILVIKVQKKEYIPLNILSSEALGSSVIEVSLALPPTRQTDSLMLWFKYESAQSTGSVCLHRASHPVGYVNPSDLETRFPKPGGEKTEMVGSTQKEKRREGWVRGPQGAFST